MAKKYLDYEGAQHLVDKVRGKISKDVIYIGSRVSNVTVEEGKSKASPKKSLHSLVFDETKKKFLLATPDLNNPIGTTGNGMTQYGNKYYADWADAEEYGKKTAEGVEPSKDKIYIDTDGEFEDEVNIFLWTGSTFVSLHFRDIERLQDLIYDVENKAHRMVLVTNFVDSESYSITAGTAPAGSSIYLDEGNEVFVAKSGDKYYADWAGASENFGNKVTDGRQPKAGRLYISYDKLYYTDDGVTLYQIGSSLYNRVRALEEASPVAISNDEIDEMFL